MAEFLFRANIFVNADKYFILISLIPLRYEEADERPRAVFAVASRAQH